LTIKKERTDKFRRLYAQVYDKDFYSDEHNRFLHPDLLLKQGIDFQISDQDMGDLVSDFFLYFA